MALNQTDILTRLAKARLIEKGTPVSYAKFKAYAYIARYNGSKYRIVFVGQPTENLFGFYVASDADPIVLKEAYGWFRQLAKGDMTPYDEGFVQVGNKGIPTTYSGIKLAK